jgi:hypothetical protein
LRSSGSRKSETKKGCLLPNANDPCLFYPKRLES